MIENCDVNYANGEEESDLGIKSKETKVDSETADPSDKMQNKSLEMNDINSDVETNVFNETVKEIDKDPVHENELEYNNIFKKFSSIVDSDSEEEDAFISKPKRKNPVYDSSEDETSDLNKSIKSNKHLNKKTTTAIFLNSDSDETCDDINATDDREVSNGKMGTNSVQDRFRSLIDSESEEENEKQLYPVESSTQPKQKGNRESKTRKVSSRAAKDEAMKQIQSETQRLIRETEISLPYHRPRQRTLQEFLTRKKVLSVLPKAPTMAAKLKMSSAIVDEVLKEKEKEAEIFYKSSDSEEEVTENHSLPDKENTNIGSTQELKKDKASRKLFVDDNLFTDNKEGNSNASITPEMNEILTETKDIESNKSITHDEINRIENNLISDSYCEVNDNLDTRITNPVEEIKMTKVDNLPEKAVVEDENKNDEEITMKSIDQGENDKANTFKTADEFSDASTSNSINDYANIVKQSLGIAAEESDDYNEYGLPPPKLDISPIISGKKLLPNVQSLKPKIRGSPGIMIDLTDDIKPNKKGVNALIDRFMSKHSKTNKQTKNEQDVSVIQVKQSSNGLSITKEILPYKLPNLENEDPKLNKPGAKLKRLKEELKQKMALKRDEEWKQKEQEMKEQEIEWNESINEEDDFNVPCSPSIESYKSKAEEEDEDEEEEEEEDEDELEEDDVMKEKKRSKCDFVDSEAEVSDDEENDSDEIIEEDEDENLEDDGKECEGLILEEDSSTCDSINASSKHKTFKRITGPFEDDSRSSSAENDKDAVNEDKNTSFLQPTSVDMFNEAASDNESDIPVSQAHVGTSSEYQASKTPQSKINTFNFVSPLTQLTALNTRLESEKGVNVQEESLDNESNGILLGSTQVEESFQSPQHSKKEVTLQRKLFIDQTVTLDDELLELCSGRFTQDKSNLNLSKEPEVTESQLLELCSGTFTTQVNNAENLNVSKSVEKGSLSIETSTQNEEQSEKNGMFWNKLSIVSSDEEDEIEKEVSKPSKRKVKRLDLSDNEDEIGSSVSSDEEPEDNNDKYVDYDSEENEVIVPAKNIKQYAANFLEEEAELSESDCDVSADENEEDLDKLELEEGDNEEIDEAEMKSQLGKLHMRQVLDDDQKEVNMLKELLFEDGDLFGESVRERKLKWKNIDKQDGNDDFIPSEDKDGWVDLSDEEDEVKWRKQRYEREKFLAEKVNEKNEFEDVLGDSEIFKFGLKILKKRRIDESQTQNTLLETQHSSRESRIPHTIAEMLKCANLEGGTSVLQSVMKRRSFLARGEESLARLAAVAKQKDTHVSSVNQKNFVFTYIDPSTDTKDETSTIKPSVDRSKARKKH